MLKEKIIQDKIRKSLFILLLLWAMPFSVMAAGVPIAEGDQLVNRRVLILDFINVKNSAEFSYLEGSIPESFLDPLTKTKSFEIILRTTWAKYVTQQRFNKEDAYKEEVAIEAGKLSGADIVVIGQFIAMTDHIQMFAKALEVSSGRVMISLNNAAPLDNDLFNAIENLANQMSAEMKNKMPPLPQKVIIQQRIQFVTNAPTSNKALIRQAQIEAKAQQWRTNEAIQAERWRAMEAEQASRWRMMESATVGAKARESIMLNTYWAQPLSMRLLGNLFIGTLTGAAMGFTTGAGFGTTPNQPPDLLISSVFGATGAGLGLITGILVTIYDNVHLNESALGSKMLGNTTLWWGFGILAGSAIGTGIGYISTLNFQIQALAYGAAIGSLVGLGTGIILTVLPALNIIPQEKLNSLIFDINPQQSRIGYGIRF